MSRSISSQAVTAADIADAVGVSRTTVSFVLRGHAKQKGISPETTERVLAAVKKLNYVPNHMARSLRQGRSGTIGVIFGNFKADWVESIMIGMTDVLEAAGYTPFVAAHRGRPERAERELISCLQRCDEGIICLPLLVDPEIYDRVQHARIPMVFLGDRPREMSNISLVGWDSAAAARSAVDHLIETGRRRIAYVGVDYPMELAPARYDAYTAALRDAGLEFRPEWTVNAPTTWPLDRITMTTFERLFAKNRARPDALFAVNDGIAIGLLEALDAKGVRVPDDVAVIGMGDYPMTGHSMISLSTVKEPCEEMGRQAAEAMAELIKSPEAAPIARLIPGRELKVRRTTEPASKQA